MIFKLLQNPVSRRLLMYVGPAGICAIIGVSIYTAAIHAVTPTHRLQAAASLQPAPTVQEERSVLIKGQSIRVSVADTDALREQGLSGRQGLAADEGMLFIFPSDGIYPFWMKDMLFSIDMAWIGSDGKVVYIAKNAAPETYPNNFKSDKPARYVLELPAGWSDAHGLSIGDQVSL